MDADIPLGLLAIPFGFKDSLNNWKCFLGGPYILYAVTVTLGLILLCIPKNIPYMLTRGILDESNFPISPLSIDVHHVETLSSVNCLDGNPENAASNDELNRSSIVSALKVAPRPI